MDDERLQVLKMLESGQIGADEAAQLLAALEPAGPGDESGAPGAPDSAVSVDAAEAEAPEWSRQAAGWKRYWIYGAMAGGALLVIGALIMGLVAATDAARGWRICGWVPMVGGLLVALVAWWAGSARWLYVRVREKGEPGLTLAFPVPLSLAAWAVRIARPFVPRLKDTSLDEVILALRDAGGQGRPMVVDIDDRAEGEQVQLYFG